MTTTDEVTQELDRVANEQYSCSFEELSDNAQENVLDVVKGLISEV